MGRRSRNRSGQEERDPSPIANDPLDSLLFEPVSPATPFSPSPVPFDDLAEIQDRRLFHPDPDYVGTITGDAEIGEVYSPSVPRKTNKKHPLQTSMPRGVMAFSQPAHVAVCVRRQQRREVLHALRKTGRGGSARRRYNHNSKIRC